jgi:hypothetical protein
MPQTKVRGSQLKPATVQRKDLNVDTVGQAVVTKIIFGTGASASTSTGVDSGTGDVTLNG